MADNTKPETPAPKIVPQTGDATGAAATTGSPVAGQTASAPPTGANRAVSPQQTTTPAARPAPAPGPAAPAAAPAAAATATATTAASAHATRPAAAAAPRPAPAPIPDLAGK